MEASLVGCDGQLVDLRFVLCEVRPEKVFHFLDEWRLVEKMRFCTSEFGTRVSRIRVVSLLPVGLTFLTESAQLSPSLRAGRT